MTGVILTRLGITAIVIMIIGGVLGFLLGVWNEAAFHACPEPDHTGCELDLAAKQEQLDRANVAFGDAVDQYNRIVEYVESEG